MFETFQVQNVYVALQAVMSLYAAGSVTGLVVDSGDGVSHTTPVFEGFSIPHAVEKMDVAGRVFDDWMKTLLHGIGESFNSSNELTIVRDIKEKLSYVAEDFEFENKVAQYSSENDT